ncbi:hypothetical protein [Pseudomonas xionganensis]|uniref:Uncharacterized protein n=1 Tax=Pseudomonas xionganensis TaxID=2654845 RepID=A0A6I4KTI8_9PSED|nr:hypothetical protein [Pseudomonas xionganensis]MVW75394.1 hypothetical protein [Pseudomonas xionganensis]
MSEMGAVVVRRIGELDVVCRELTVGQLRGLIGSAGDGEVVGDFLFEQVRLADLPRMTNLTAEQIAELRPSQLQSVVEACQEANPDFFKMLARLDAAGRAS